MLKINTIFILHGRFSNIIIIGEIFRGNTTSLFLTQNERKIKYSKKNPLCNAQQWATSIAKSLVVSQLLSLHSLNANRNFRFVTFYPKIIG